MFSIGEFSRLCRISARMLRHYDRLGLLPPASIGEVSGYRYYEASQLKILARIEALKSYGFSLLEVKFLLTLSPEEQKPYFIRQCEELRGKSLRMQAAVRRMERELAQTEVISMKTIPAILVMEDPEQNILGIRKTIDITGEAIHQLFQELHQERTRLGLKQAGPCQLTYLQEEFMPQNALVEAQVWVDGDAPGVKRLPSRTCVTAIHKGSMEDAHETYAVLCQWLAAHPDYVLCGESVERYLKDEKMAPTPEELETAILFPVKRRSEG